MIYLFIALQHLLVTISFYNAIKLSMLIMIIINRNNLVSTQNQISKFDFAKDAL